MVGLLFLELGIAFHPSLLHLVCEERAVVDHAAAPTAIVRSNQTAGD